MQNGDSLALLNDTKKPESTNTTTHLNKSRSLSISPQIRRDLFHQSSMCSMPMSEDEEEEHEPLEDVRMCCNGKHHVSRLERDQAHRHHYRKRKSRATIATVA